MITEADLLSIGFSHGEKMKIMIEVNVVNHLYNSPSKLRNEFQVF